MSHDLKSKQWVPGPDTKPSIGARKREDLTFLVGVVTDLDPDRYTMSVLMDGGIGELDNIPISQPFSGTNSYIATMPQIGSTVVLANQYNLLCPIAYLPNYTYALDAKHVRIFPEGINLPQSNDMFFKFPKLKVGDVAFSSANGAEISLKEELTAKHLSSEFVLDGMLEQTVSTSLNNFMFSSGVWRNSGIITRNLYDSTNDEDGQFAHTEMTGKKKRTRLRIEPDDHRYFSEYLLEVEDVVDDGSPRNEINSELSDNNRRPAAILALGNLVGNNPSRDSYGQVLKASLFSTPDDDTGVFALESLTGEDALRYGMAVSLFAPLGNHRNPETGGYVGIDKEGHIYMYAPSTTAGGLGNGRSISILAQGSKKEIFGMDSKYGTSWDMVTKGGVRWVLGTHNEKDGNPYSNRSIDIRTEGTAFYMYGEADPDVYDFNDDETLLDNLRKYKKIEKVDGGERVEIDGNRETIIDAGDFKSVGGIHREGVAGAYTLNVGQDMNVGVASVYSERASKEKQETYGSLITTITSGDAELNIKSVVGDISETIQKKGSRKTQVNIGDIAETIVKGSRTVDVVSGNIQTRITTKGNYTVVTSSGDVDLSTRIGTFTAKSTLKATLKTGMAGSVEIEGGSINLKSKERRMGGIVTDKTHFDYITGAPLVGSKTVKAAGLPG